MGSALDMAASLSRDGAPLQAPRLDAMESDPGDRLAAALALLGRAANRVKS
jgi:hypothetical protein